MKTVAAMQHPVQPHAAKDASSVYVASDAASVSSSARVRPDCTEIDRRLECAAVPIRAFELLCRHNSDVRRQDEEKATLTYYHSTQEPPVSIGGYAERIARYSECGPLGVLLGLRLVGRCHTTSGVTLTRLSAHRLLITGMTLGVKAHFDRFRSNKTVAKAGGLQLRELNGLEYAFFKELGWRAVVTQEEIAWMEAESGRALDAQDYGDLDAAIRHARAAFCEFPPPPPPPAPQPKTSTTFRRTDSDASLQSLDDEASPPQPARATYRAGASLAADAPAARPDSCSASQHSASLGASRSGVLKPTAQAHPNETSQLQLRRFASVQATGPVGGPCAASNRSMLNLCDVSTRSEVAGAHRFTQRTMHVWNPHAPPNADLDRSESSAFMTDLMAAAAELERSQRRAAVPLSVLLTHREHHAAPKAAPQPADDLGSISPKSAN